MEMLINKCSVTPAHRIGQKKAFINQVLPPFDFKHGLDLSYDINSWFYSYTYPHINVNIAYYSKAE